jgi:hypothetical protein
LLEDEFRRKCSECLFVDLDRFQIHDRHFEVGADGLEDFCIVDESQTDEYPVQSFAGSFLLFDRLTQLSVVDESFLIENGSDAHVEFSKPDESITEAGWFGRLVRMNASN